MKAIEGSLILGVAVAVVCFGGTEPVSFAAVEIMFFAMAVWLAVRPPAATAALRPTYFSVPAILAGVAFLQLCPLPPFVRGVLAGRGAEFRNSSWGVLTLTPYQTRSELLILLTCCLAFFLGTMVSGERARKRRLMHALVALGAAEALYGLIQYLANWQNIFWYAKKYDLQEATGTYINRNHFAGLLEMVLPFAVGLAIYEGEKLGGERNHRSRRVAGTSSNLAKMTLWLGVAVVIVAAIVFSRSRMGILCACASLIVVLGLNGLQKKAVPLGVTGAFLVLSLSFASWIGLRPALNRFENVGQEFSSQNETRLSVWPGAVELIRQRPLIGSGLGAFPIAYTAFQSTFLTRFLNHAHNDYLEFSADLGIPAAVALFAAIVWVLCRGIRTFLRAESRFERNTALACVGSIATILLHSLTDFNLHIPANALVLATILGITLASSSVASQSEATA